MVEFKWYLNRQGVRGAKGDKGEKGFSPVITEKENTKESYVLHIQNETDDTSFDTPNLKEGLVPEDLGGTYVKLNRDTGRQYYGNIDEGTNTIKGIVRFATDVEASNGEEVTAAVTPDQVAEHYTTKAATDKLSADLTALTTQEQNDVIALGKRITTNETNISSMRADINSIASDSASLKNSNRFTGTNTFTGKVNIAGAPLEVDGVATLNQVTANYLNAVNITSSGEINAVSIKANGLRSDDIQTIENKKYLTEVDVDNQTIQVVNGKLHANLDEIGNEVNDLSGRVTANEADISTMKTSLSMKQTKLTAGTNITLTDLSDGTVKINAAGGGGSGATIDDSITATTSVWSSSKTNTEITTVANEVAQVQGDVASLDGDVSTLKTDVPILKVDVSGLKTDVSGLKTSKQNTLVSGTNIKTINNNSILGNGNLTLDGLPTQTGQSGKFLTTDGTDASWGNLPVATASTVGVVKPDNASIRVDNDGTLSAICRNVGEIITSTLPLTDAGLHLLDGSLLQYGIYKEFIDYIADLYNDTKVYNPSAFTVVGSPNITDDGIASGFDSGRNYINVPYRLDVSKPYDIEFNYKNTINANSSRRIILLDSKNIDYQIINCEGYDTSTNKFGIRLQCKDVLSNVIQILSNKIFEMNKEYFFKMSFTGTAYELYYKDDISNTYTLIGRISNTNPLNADGIVALCRAGSGSPSDSIDLKQFSITVDGKEAFSGRKPAKYFTDETTWQNSVTTYGSCGKFVYDSTNNTVRLPKITGIIEGTTDVTALGDLVEAGLPNITGDINASNVWGGAGAFLATGEQGYDPAPTKRNYAKIQFDASRSSSIYGNSDTVQPQTIKAFYYIVIANSAKTEIQVDIDEVATDLNGKADVDLTNTTDQAKIFMASMGMPSNKYIELTPGASDSTYIAPANGWFAFKAKATNNNYSHVGLYNTSNSWIGHKCTIYNGVNITMSVLLPIKKGDIASISYMSNTTDRDLRFIPAQGSESEA